MAIKGVNQQVWGSKINVFVVSARQRVIWLGASGVTLHFMSCACKGYKSIYKIKTFHSNVKQKVLNDEKC